MSTILIVIAVTIFVLGFFSKQIESKLRFQPESLFRSIIFLGIFIFIFLGFSLPNSNAFSVAGFMVCCQAISASLFYSGFGIQESRQKSFIKVSSN